MRPSKAETTQSDCWSTGWQLPGASKGRRSVEFGYTRFAPNLSYRKYPSNYNNLSRLSGVCLICAGRASHIRSETAKLAVEWVLQLRRMVMADDAGRGHIDQEAMVMSPSSLSLADLILISKGVMIATKIG